MAKTETASNGIGLGAQAIVALLRIGLGWHFLYQGIIKFVDPQWTSQPYLANAVGPFADFYHMLANSGFLYYIDQLNTWGLMLIGLALMLGVLTRFAAFWGIVLLALYYGAYPPLLEEVALGPFEGSALIINKTLLELLGMVVVFVLPSKAFGFDGWIIGQTVMKRTGKKSSKGEAVEEPTTRRQLIGALTTLPFLGAFGYLVYRKKPWESNEEAILAKETEGEVDAVSGATKSFTWSKYDQLEEEVPKAKIKDVTFSRLILGGNLIGGWAHARDLIYVSKLVKAYHTQEKVFQTFRLAEACGVNTILTNPILCDVINAYWEKNLGKIQFISDCGGKDVLNMVKKSIDQGATACYVQGATADDLVAKGDFDTIAKCLELIRDNGLPAGIGGHRLETIQGCVEEGFDPDFWMKTLHHTKYWSAQAETEKDNIYCRKPDETIEFMESLPQPWIAFKILAAGAIHPKDGFRYAFQNGADFICVGMYDFQIVDDCNIAVNVLDSIQERKRPWQAETIA